MSIRRFTVALLLGLLATVVQPTVAEDEIKSFGRRIVGGEPTTIQQHPWQVALNIKTGGQTFLCGGSMVADRWVLTAAHCFTQSTNWASSS